MKEYSILRAGLRSVARWRATEKCCVFRMSPSKTRRKIVILKLYLHSARERHHFVPQYALEPPWPLEPLRCLPDASQMPFRCSSGADLFSNPNEIFFHPNVLHRSEANLSDTARWSVISAYNLAHNIPFREKNTSCITSVSMVPDEALLASGKKEVNQADFLLKEKEITLQVK